MNEVKIFITLDKLKIQSINSMYKAGLIYRGGKQVPYIYKSAESKKVADIMLESLRAINWTEHLGWLSKTLQFTVTQNYIFKSGISRRDTGNCEKLISDVLVRFIRDELGIAEFDDSKFTDLHLYKSIIPGGEHEYICISIKPSMFNTRFDLVPKPQNIDYKFDFGGDWVEKEVKKAHKEKELRYRFNSGQGNYRKADVPDTEVLLVDPNKDTYVCDLLRIFQKINALGDSRFLYLGYRAKVPEIEELGKFKNTFAKYFNEDDLKDINNIINWITC